MGKEFSRFFGDKRMLFSLFLPGLLIYILYTFMGNALMAYLTPDTDYSPKVYAVNSPDSLEAGMSSFHWTYYLNPENSSDEELKGMITNKDLDLYIVFPKDFDNLVSGYDVASSVEPAPNIEVYFNALETNSSDAYASFIVFLNSYESSLSNKFDINRGIEKPNLASEKDSSASILSMMMPMLIVTFLFTGCSSIGTESIAGEKERGTLGTLLVSPLKRSELALGKILSLAVLSFLIGLVSSGSTILALPKLMGGSESITINIYKTKDYLLLALLILSTLLLLISLISIISAFAKSVKEASTSVMPLMVIVMGIGVTGMFGSSPSNKLLYIIPIYNSVQCMNGIFALDYSVFSILITIISNFCYALIAGFILTKMFNSERIVFSS